jgi:polysaccharide biosynthesis protein PslJ
VTACLTVWLVLLYGISAGIVVPGFGAIGQPATLFALGTLLWWLSARMLPGLGLDQGPQPVRYALFVSTGYLIASYAMASTHFLSPLQRSGSTRALITQMALFGIAALVTDGVHDLERLRALLRRLTTLGAVFAALGIVQSYVGESLLILPPGLEWNAGVEFDIESRRGQVRPLSTGMHPIEFAVVVASLVPLAIHFFLHPRSSRDRARAAIEVSLLLLAVPVSLSRTAIVCLAAALLVLSFGWTWRRRLNALVLGFLVVPTVAALVPAAYDVMIELFAGAGSDQSVQARLSRIPNIMALIAERPWFGMGFGTFNNTDFFLVDNQLWGTTVSIGIVGLVLTLGLFLTGALTAVWVRYLPDTTEELVHLGRAIAAGIAGMTVSLATFDAFFYRILTFTLFLLLGSAGALWRLARDVPSRGRGWSSEWPERPTQTVGQ